MDNVAEYLNNCSTSTGLLGLAVLIVGAAIFLWRQNKELKIDIKDGFKELRTEIKEVRTELKNDIKEIKDDLKTLQSRVNDLDKRVCEIWGILHSKDCCILKADQNLKKAE